MSPRVFSYIPDYIPERISTEPTIAFSRYISVITCLLGNEKCIGPVVKNLDSANVEKKFERFNKGNRSGRSALDSSRIVEEGIPFDSEVRISRKESSTYFVYLMHRSGPTTSRNGVVKTFEVNNISMFKNLTVVDKEIKFTNGELRAELTFGPQLKLSK